MYSLSVIIPVYNQEDLLLRALESVPANCEIIVVDDGSTDSSINTALKFKNDHPNQKVEVLYNFVNKGVSTAVNKGLELATGDYIVLLGSDDYFYTDRLKEVMAQMDGTDLIYFDLVINSGDVFKLSNDTKFSYCGSVKLMRRAFIGNTRNDESTRSGEDYFFFRELQAKKPTEKFTGISAKHYNYPREGSLFNTHGGVISEG